MSVDIDTSKENKETPKNEYGAFCDISKILNSEFNEEKEYNKILEELNISEKFEGKSEKRITLLRHFEDNKDSGINEELTDNGLLSGNKKSEQLSQYFKKSNIIIRYAGVGKNREIVYRTSQTAELLVNNLENISGIIQEDGLDSTYKNDNKKTKNLVDQEIKTIDFLERFKKEQSVEKIENDEIWIVHKTNMDKILREFLEILPENKAFYGALDFGETIEFDMGFNEEGKINFLRQDSSLIKLTSNNYLDIIEELESTEDIPENIKKAIKYFEDGKIKIIDLQNVINKNIMENNSFLEQFKNSNNLDLIKLSFINILKGEDFFDEEIEKIILEEKFGKKIDEIIDIFYEMVKQKPNIKIFETIVFDYKNSKEYLDKILKIIGIINSKKIINTEQNNKLFEIFNYFKTNGNNDLSKYEKVIENSILGLGNSKIFGENLYMFKDIFDVDKNIENQNFIFRINLSDYGFNQLNLYLFYKENGKNKKHKIHKLEEKSYKMHYGHLISENEIMKDIDKFLKEENTSRHVSQNIHPEMYKQFIEYINKNYKFEPNYDPDYGKTLILNLVFENGRLLLEREELLSHFEGQLNHSNLSILSEFENYLEKSFIDGKTSNDFNDFLEINKKMLEKYIPSKIDNILMNIKKNIFSTLLEGTEDEYLISDYTKNTLFYSINKLDFSGIITDKKYDILKILKKEYIRKSKIFNILLSKMDLDNFINKNNRRLSIEFSVFNVYKDLNIFFDKIKD